MEIKEFTQIITIFEQSSLSEMEITSETFSIHLKKPTTNELKKLPKIIKTEEKKDDKPKKSTKTITSPIVGTFYRTPSPDSPPYVEVGKPIRTGDVVCTIEAMKLMNQMEAEFDCEIVAVLADQGSLVEFGQPLFEVLPL
ncbi:MAG: acetyl-CoA carboxylase biotin carboxyl carrier protein [Sphaerochaetaceae bacterium]|jgi:acetyl-CoA carboxylase biotin carboxyl carrier protein